MGPLCFYLHQVMFSIYKNHITVKCFMATSPGGGFVSALFPRKMSDRDDVKEGTLR